MAGLEITEEGDIEDFLGVNIDKVDSETYHLSQPQPIKKFLSDLGLSKSDRNPRTTPSLASNILGNYQYVVKIDQQFHYCSIIDKLNYLGKNTWPEIAYTVHQCAKFSENPRKPHGWAVKKIWSYLKGNGKLGIYIPPRDSNVKLWAHADFSSIFLP